MLNPPNHYLINGTTVDAVPAALFRAKASADARLLARSQWLVRDKRDGRYLACMSAAGIAPLRRLPRATATDALWQDLRTAQHLAGSERPITGVLQMLASLGIDHDRYSRQTGLALTAEPYTLEYAGKDRYARPLWLHASAKAAWQRMQAAAGADRIVLQAISGYRSHCYQLGIFRRKLARGQHIDEILGVNAAPGFSEHHSGRAIDIGTAGEPAAQESFENTPAFSWLMRRAGDFGFRLSYPRGNPNGIVYEPWHWYWAGGGQS